MGCSIVQHPCLALEARMADPRMLSVAEQSVQFFWDLMTYVAVDEPQGILFVNLNEGGYI